MRRGCAPSPENIRMLFREMLHFGAFYYRAAWNAEFCRRGLAMRFLSVRLSVGLSNACIVTKRKKSQSRFLYHAIDNLV